MARSKIGPRLVQVSSDTINRERVIVEFTKAELEALMSYINNATTKRSKDPSVRRKTLNRVLHTLGRGRQLLRT